MTAGDVHGGGNRNESEKDLTRRLGVYQDGLRESLEGVLDIEAGLREVLLQSRHRRRVDDLATVIDVEAGLAAILPVSSPVPTPAPGGAVASPVQDFLRSLTAEKRMALRHHPGGLRAGRLLALTELHDKTGVVPAEMTPFVVSFAHEVAQALISEFKRQNGLRQPKTRYMIHQITQALDTSLLGDGALVRPLSFAKDLLDAARSMDESVVHLAHELLTTLYALSHLKSDGLKSINAHERLPDLFTTAARRAISSALGIPVPQEFDAGSLKMLLNDFTASDLTTTDLTGIDLSGVRWSEGGTLWPDTVDIHDLKSRSTETPAGSGVYVVRDGTTTLRDLVGLV
ncbi:hypothetical protein QR77_24915 [Streptomyces sp. 150FB]|uniref:hypothetical protein n=1 Tax=Streptomyces sp. 150FB TaxID=1576605 RepID=UPI0005896964|nr:hypothetical protein [Streptomyces sp. 150FB]KIF76256.1 hypothetical protein QR77_24915 [Streptomyces sp. 150FB]